jgi:hypothetical protein
LGYARSGTTWLRTRLDQSSNTCIPPESSFITFLEPQFGNWSAQDLASNSMGSFVDELFGARKFENWGLTRADVMREVAHKRPSSYSELCTSVYQTYARVHNYAHSLLGDKNNIHGLHVRKLSELFPTARFVHLIRDPRAIYQSFRSLGADSLQHKYAPKVPGSVKEFALDWRRYLSSVSRLRNSASHRLLEVRYEDCMISTSTTLGNIRDFVGAKRRVHPAERGFRSLEPELDLPWKKNVLKPSSPDPVDNWRSRLPREDSSKIEEILEPEMLEFGYPVSRSV